MIDITFVILCGGSGTRLWPLSRSDYPKQFIDIIENKSLFQQTFERVIAFNDKKYTTKSIIVVTNEKHRFLVLKQLKSFITNVPIEIILEPESKNTAPALTLAALQAKKINEKSILVACPSDHYIGSLKKYHDAIKKALNTIAKALNKDQLILTLGIKPTNPETGFGYIQTNVSEVVKDVSKFVEKPDFASAKKMILSGDFYWNSGIFILTPSAWIEAIKKFEPSLYTHILKAWKNTTVDNIFLRPEYSYFKKSPSQSIDYAVMERAISYGIDLKLIELEGLWSDMGSFSSFDNVYNADIDGNIFSGNVVSEDSVNNIAISTKRLITLLNVENIIIVETSDAVLVADRKNTNSLKKLIKKLSKSHKDYLTVHEKVFRPWGWFETINEGKYFKVKKIHVEPKEKLSYQSHSYRNEHWVVVQGVATIKINDQILKLHPNESTYIEKLAKHQLINLENNPLEIVEIQTGKILSEEDIIRYEDHYGRC